MEHLVDATKDIDVLCEAIVDRYHASLRERLPRIREELAAVGATTASPALDTLQIAFTEVADQIAAHMAKEELLLFPAIAALSKAERAGGRRPALFFGTVMNQIRLMEAEHGRIEMAITRLREMARSVPETDTASSAWQQCTDDLAKLDAELRAHHRAENEVLFPRVLELERRLM